MVVLVGRVLCPLAASILMSDVAGKHTQGQAKSVCGYCMDYVVGGCFWV